MLKYSSIIFVDGGLVMRALCIFGRLCALIKSIDGTIHDTTEFVKFAIKKLV